MRRGISALSCVLVGCSAPQWLPPPGLEAAKDRFSEEFSCAFENVDAKKVTITGFEVAGCGHVRVYYCFFRSKTSRYTCNRSYDERLHDGSLYRFVEPSASPAVP